VRVTLADLQAMKAVGAKIAMLTAYDYSSALIASRAGVPMLLVGDSLGMVMHGHETTLPVTLDDMVRHTAAVVRGAGGAFVVADLPFMTYATAADAVVAARRLMGEAGAHAVKLEGGRQMADAVRTLTAFGAPVMGHLGLTPQSQHRIGLKIQGKDAAAARRLMVDALALQEAGAFAVVLELVPADLAAAITASLSIPTIGIGAGVGCDGQVQVWHDILGLYGDRPPRHAKRFAEVGEIVEAALKDYVAQVGAGVFPSDRNSAKMDSAELALALSPPPTSLS
jgi:3-methyl-2-oxobutanoate hydroxymethyltransferase